MGRRITKPIRYEQHALLRMAQRFVRTNQVEAAIADPHERRAAKRPGAIRIVHRMNASATLNVIIEETATFIRVVTVWVAKT